MPFDPLRVTTPNQDDQRLYPSLDVDGVPRWEPGDTNIVHVRAVGLGSCQGAIANERRHRDIDADVYVTDARVVVVCERWAKGTKRRAAYLGGPVISSAIANRVSQHRADKRAEGQYLVGQMRLPWVNRVAYSLRDGRHGENVVRVATTHLTAFNDTETVMLVLHLDRSSDPSSLAGDIARRAVADRIDFERTTDDERASLRAARWPAAAELAPGTIPSIGLAGAFRANAASAYLGTSSARSGRPPS